MKKTLYYIVYAVFLAYQMTMIDNKTSSVVEGDWTTFKAIYYLLMMAAAIGFCMLCKHRGKLPLFGKTFLLFYCYVIFISVYHALTKPSPDMGPTVIIEGCLPLFLFFVSYYAQQDEELVKATKLTLLLLFVSFTYGLIKGYSMITGFLQDEFIEQNNSYVFLFILPYIALINHKEKYLKYFLIATVVAVIVSMKRGGILGLLSGMLVYFYIKPSADNRVRRTPLMNAVFLMSGLLVLYFLIDSTMRSVITARFYDISETGGSGRDLIWLETTNAISRSDTRELIIGHGWDKVKTETTWEIGAHSDYLETIYDFGWIGFVLFILFIVTAIIYMFKNKSLYSAAPLGMAVFSYIAVAFVCHIIPQTEYFDLFSLAIGGVCGTYAMNNKQRKFIKRRNNIE